MNATATRATHKPGARGAASHARSRARAFAVQGLYQLLVGKGDIDAIDAFTRDLAGFGKCDAEHYARLLHGCATAREALDATLQPALDRPLAELSPIEHGVLWIGVLELQQCPDVPWRVVLNECVELAKDFGGTDGHKFVNGVLHRLAPQLRDAEVATDQATLAPVRAPMP